MDQRKRTKRSSGFEESTLRAPAVNDTFHISKDAHVRQIDTKPQVNVGEEGYDDVKKSQVDSWSNLMDGIPLDRRKVLKATILIGEGG